MPRRYAILTTVLAMVALGALLFAWKLGRELAAVDLERATLATEVQSLKALALKHDKPVAPVVIPAGPPQPVATPAAAISGGQPRKKSIGQIPEMQQFMLLRTRAALDYRFAALFRQLNLSPDALARFKDLLAERISANNEVYEAAQAIGLGSSTNAELLRRMVDEAQAKVDATVAASLGDGVLQQYKQYAQTEMERNLANQVEMRLSYSPTPLSRDQNARLAALFVADAGQAVPVGAIPAQDALENGPRFRGGLASLSDNALAQSRAFLSSSQADALSQMRDEARQRYQLSAQAEAKLKTEQAGAMSGP